MSFQFHPLLYGQVSITGAATLICPQNSSAAGSLIVNSGASTVYLGDAAVTTTTGYPLAAGTSVSVPTTNAIYGVAASSGTVGFLTCQ